MNEPSTIPATTPLPTIAPDETSQHTEVYHNVKIGKCPALRTPKLPTGTTITHHIIDDPIEADADLAKSPMLLAPERITTYLRNNPEVTVALMCGIVRPAMLKELSRVVRGVAPAPEVSASGSTVSHSYCKCINTALSTVDQAQARSVLVDAHGRCTKCLRVML